MSINRDTLRQIVNILALVFTLAVNFMATALPLNGQTTQEISDRLPILFVPEGYVFSIWGVIYTFLIGFGIYQALPAQRENPLLRCIGYWFAFSCVANAAWLFAFHYNQFLLSMVFMLALLAALIVIYLRLDIGRTRLQGAGKWLLHVPFSIYLAWITIATVANASYVLYDAQWDGFGIAPEVWTVAMLAIATCIVLAVIATRRDTAYTAVIIWALVGIVIKQSDTAVVAGTAALAAALVLGALLLFRIWRDGGRTGGPMEKALSA